jgi:hypothetical protein
LLTLHEYLDSLRVCCWVRVAHLFIFLCCVVCFCPVSCVPKSLCYLFGNFHTFYIHLCMQLEQNVKNSCNLLQRQSYIRTKGLSIFTRPTWTNYISLLSRRQTYCLSRIASPYDSSSYTHTIMFWLLPFYLLTKTYHISDEGVLLSVGGWGSITTFMWPLISRSNWFWRHFRFGDAIFLSFDIDLSSLIWMWIATRQCKSYHHVHNGTLTADLNVK